MKYPEERLLIVRPCLKAICYRDKPASKLLSLLLYYARNCDEQETEFTFTSRQDDIITDLLDEMDVKTLHRTAIPMLRLLGYIDVDGSSYRYTYTVHIGYIQKMLNFYATNKQQLDKCLIDIMRKQLDIYPEQLDIFLKQLDKSRIQLDKCLIPFRQMSNSKRGRKPRPQEAAEAHFKDPQITIDNKDITENIDVNASALTPTHSSENESQSHYQQSDGTSQQDIHQPSKDVHIATTKPQGSASIGMPIRNTGSLFEDILPAPEKAKQNGKSTQAETPPKPRAKINPDEQAFKDAWDASEGIITPPTKGIWVAIKTLRGYGATVELVTEAVAIMRAEKYWQERGVTLEDAARNYGKYGSLAQQHKKKANEPKPRPAALSPENVSNERKRKMLENTVTQRAEMDARKAARLAQARGE